MTTQPALFPMASDPQGRAAALSQTSHIHDTTCTCKRTTGDLARCQTRECDHIFTVKIGGAGTRYCPNHAHRWYHQQTGWSCAKCSTHYRQGYAPRHRICRRCLPSPAARQAITRYKMTPEWAIRYITSTHCEWCGDPFGRFTSESVGGRNVDHAHTCCPGKESCGDCIRGIVCFRCNTGLGLVEAWLTAGRTLTDILNYLKHSTT